MLPSTYHTPTINISSFLDKIFNSDIDLLDLTKLGNLFQIFLYLQYDHINWGFKVPLLLYIFVNKNRKCRWWRDTLLLNQRIKCQCCPHIETSQLICTANQLTGFYMRATQALNGLMICFTDYHWYRLNQTATTAYWHLPLLAKGNSKSKKQIFIIILIHLSKSSVTINSSHRKKHLGLHETRRSRTA